MYEQALQNGSSTCLMVDKVKMLIRMNKYYKEEVGCVILFEVEKSGLLMREMGSTAVGNELSC